MNNFKKKINFNCSLCWPFPNSLVTNHWSNESEKKLIDHTREQKDVESEQIALLRYGI